MGQLGCGGFVRPDIETNLGRPDYGSGLAGKADIRAIENSSLVLSFEVDTGKPTIPARNTAPAPNLLRLTVPAVRAEPGLPAAGRHGVAARSDGLGTGTERLFLRSGW
jgi:hypothetical protein